MSAVADVESSESSNLRKREPVESPKTRKKRKVSETIQANFIKLTSHKCSTSIQIKFKFREPPTKISFDISVKINNQKVLTQISEAKGED